MFVDKVKIHARAGDGGNGSVSFRREKYIDRGGPDGGSGGNGGDIVLLADKNASDLSDFHFTPRLVAKNGIHGRGKNRAGRNGGERVFRVPVGTQVYQLTQPVRQLGYQRYRPAAVLEEQDFKDTKMMGLINRAGRARDALAAKRAAEDKPKPDDEAAELPPLDEHKLIVDMVDDGQRFILAHGGKGGRGNFSFRSSTHQAPREFEYGEPGEELQVELELKTLADAGLVGYPNAGKSTLLSRLTRAHPKIAAYPFTTLTPNVGLTDFDDYTRVTIADIPGLIEGAHEGRGLGYEFLRHIERCRILLILIDMAGVDARQPWDDYKQLLSELKLYNPELLQKNRVVVANKMDLPQSKKNLVSFKKKHKVAIIPISAQDGVGLAKLKLALQKALP